MYVFWLNLGIILITPYHPRLDGNDSLTLLSFCLTVTFFSK